MVFVFFQAPAQQVRDDGFASADYGLQQTIVETHLALGRGVEQIGNGSGDVLLGI